MAEIVAKLALEDGTVFTGRGFGLEGIDTRALVRRLRVRGAMTGVLSTRDLDDASLVSKARGSPSLVGRDLVREVIPEKPFAWARGFTSPLVTYLPPHEPKHHVV